MKTLADAKGIDVPKEITRINHLVFWLAIFCFWFSTYIYIPTFGVYLETTGLSYSAIGIILGSYGITQIILRLPLGVFSSGLEQLRKILLFVGFLLAVVSGLCLVFFDSFTFILIARLLAGVTASMWVMATILYSQYFSDDRASQAMGVMQFLTVFAQLVSMILCGFLVDYYGWEFPFWIGTVTAFVGAILILFVKEYKPVRQPPKISFKEIFHKTITLKRLKTVTTLSLIGHAILFITIFGFSPIYAVRIGFSEQEIIWLVTAFFVPHALASLFLAFYNLPAKYNQLILGSSFLVTGLFLFIIPQSDSILNLITAHIVTGLLLGLVLPILLGEVVVISTPELKLSAMGFYQSFYALGIFLGPIAAGEVAHRLGLSEVFYFAGLLSLVGLIIVLLGRRDSDTNAIRR
ncbi:MFS transporter [Sediminibacillus massiliensis]|uniref:MFS transporter n=1 Tax=Sediminibacillus massiliensis TaxID=1926277 RepID=UPI00098845A9|nr:MFS transporter [Sediminibacillus massiliensis]